MPVCPTCRTKSDDGVTVCPVDGTLLTPSHDLVGRILGDRYRILSRLGQGGMGSIYLAEHVTLGKQMAVKVLRPEYSRDAELLDRFQHEARAASQIGQENIVEVFDFGHTPEGEAYFVMEALDGESLARILHRDGPMPLARAVPIFLQICRALGAAHERGIVHRDLKPENVFVLRRNGGTDFVKVLDFGIAKGPGTPDSKRLTKAGSIIGTPEYMSPEQASSNVIDQRSDVYAFGVLAYETLTGRLPFDGDTPLATLMKHQSDAPVPPRKLRPELPPGVERIVLRALVKRPEGRQQSMEELSVELSRLAGADLEALRAPIFGTAVSPLLTGRTTDRRAPRASSRGETLPLGDTLPLRDLAPPAPEPAPSRPSVRVRRDTRSEVEVVSRRRSQFALAAVLGLLFLALLSGVVAALAVRRGDEASAGVAPTASADAPLRIDPPAVQVTAPASEPASSPVQAIQPQQEAAPEASPAPHDPPPSASAAAPPPSKPARPRPARPPPGVGSKAGSGENGASGNDLLDPYGPTAR
jgi:serine/threonine protein kinase